MKQRLLFLSLVVMLLGVGLDGWGQITIAIQDFEDTPATPTWSYSATGGGQMLPRINTMELNRIA